MRKINERNLKFWNKFAAKYDRFTGKFNTIYDVLIPKVRDHLQSRDRVLEVAAGTGKVSFGVCDIVSHITATDFSEKMIQIARNKAKEQNIVNIDFEIQNATALPYSADSFDACLFVNALHVMPEPEKAIGKIWYALKPEGRLILPTYCHGENIKSHIISRIMRLSGFRTFTRFSLKSIDEFLSIRGFKIKYREVLPDTPPIAFIVAEKI